MSYYFVYRVVHKDSGKAYIGFSSDPKRRFYEHIGCVRRGETQNRHFYAAVRKYGIDAFHWGIYKRFSTRQEALACEVDLISLIRDCGDGVYNLSSGGEHSTLSEESRNRLSQAMTGRRLSASHIESLKSKVFTEEHRANIAKSKTGLKHSEETKARLSAMNKGKKLRLGAKWSEESKARLALAKRNKRRVTEI